MENIDLQDELTKVVSDIQWDIEGVIHTDKTISPLPSESRVVTEFFQSMIIKKLERWGKAKNLTIDDNKVYGRSYPDITLHFNDKLVAIDVKSARFKNGDKISPMTLGTFDGYFLHPNDKKLYKKTRCYNDYLEHWIISVIYEWRPSEPTRSMVNIVSICVGQKWQFARKTTGSGDTANIGGITSLTKLQNLESVFANEEEFEKYWRNYAINHPRKRTKIPK